MVIIIINFIINVIIIIINVIIIVIIIAIIVITIIKFMELLITLMEMRIIKYKNLIFNLIDDYLETKINNSMVIKINVMGMKSYHIYIKEEIIINNLLLKDSLE